MTGPGTKDNYETRMTQAAKRRTVDALFLSVMLFAMVLVCWLLLILGVMLTMKLVEYLRPLAAEASEIPRPTWGGWMTCDQGVITPDGKSCNAPTGVTMEISKLESAGEGSLQPTYSSGTTVVLLPYRETRYVDRYAGTWSRTYPLYHHHHWRRR